MSLRQPSLVFAAVLLVSCGSSQSQRFHGDKLEPVPPPGPVAVNAPYDNTWDTVIELIVHDWGISTPQISRASGIVQSDMIKLGNWSRGQRSGLATCDRLDPDVVWLQVLVRGDSSRSTVEFSPRYFRWDGDNWVPCPTTGQWEHTLSDTVKARAEQRSHAHG